jgi:PAS domain S-box-containing protein
MKKYLGKVHVEKRVAQGFLLTAVVLAVLGVFSFTSTERLIDTARLLSHTTRVINNAEQVIKAIVDIETGQRGYVITGKEEFLEPYHESAKTVDFYVNKLDSLTEGSKSQQLKIDQLRSLSHRQLAWTTQVIHARKEKFENAQKMVLAGEGKRLTDAIRKIIKNIQDEERQNFARGNTISRASLQQFQYSFVGLAVFIFFLITCLFFIINKSIKARKDVEEDLSTSVLEARDLYDNAPCGYFSVNESILITDVNQTLLRWLGFSKEELVGKVKFEELLTAESKVSFLTSFTVDFEKYKRDGYVNDLEFDFLRKDGTTFPVIVSSILLFNESEFAGSRTTVSDNTDRKRAQEELKRSNDLLFNLFEYNPASIVVSRLHDAKIINVNGVFLSSFGFDSKDEVIGKTARELNIVASPEQREELAELLKTNKIIKDFEIQAFTRQGRPFWVSTSILMMEVDGLPCLFSISLDISNRKRTEEQLKAANAELEAFTYSVSHDLRAPLRSIVGYTQILSEDYGSRFDDEGRRVMNVVIHNTKRMGQLIDDLLDFSRISRKELARAQVNMKELVENIVQELVEQENGRQLDIRVHSLESANADNNTIRQVWINLISNALKYSRNMEVTKIEIGSFEKNDQRCYYIRDNGAGFDMQYVDKLFGVFQRLHKMNEFEGTGIGLALVKTIVKRHGGYVWAEGELNKGATFYFALPSNEQIEV